MTEKKLSVLLEIIILLFLFAAPFTHVLLFIIGKNSESGQLAIVYIGVAIGAFVLCFRFISTSISAKTFGIFLFMLIATMSFLLTRVRYGNGNAQFNSELHSFLAMEVCIALLVIGVCWNKSKSINGIIILFADIVFTLVSFLVMIRGNDLTTGGLISDTSGMLYQDIAYYSAYAFGFTVYLLHEYKGITRNIIMTIGVMALVLVQIFTCFMSGGRGGVVLFAVLLIYGIMSVYGIKKTYKIIIPILGIGLVIVLLFPAIINRLGIDLKGFTRILNIFDMNDLSTQGRTAYAYEAIQMFKRNPLLGNGIGSIFFYLGNYSHNMFTDVLAETGILGFVVFVFILVHFCKKMKRLYYFGSLYRFLLVVFLCGITCNLFSGYIWVNQLVWFPIAMIIMAPQEKVDEFYWMLELIEHSDDKFY